MHGVPDVAVASKNNINHKPDIGGSASGIIENYNNSNGNGIDNNELDWD